MCLKFVPFFHLPAHPGNHTLKLRHQPLLQEDHWAREIGICESFPLGKALTRVARPLSRVSEISTAVTTTPCMHQDLGKSISVWIVTGKFNIQDSVLPFLIIDTIWLKRIILTHRIRFLRTRHLCNRFYYTKFQIIITFLIV